MRWVIALAGAVVVANIVVGLVRTDNFDHGAVADYLFDPRVLAGVRNTLLLTAIAMTVGSIIGLASASMRLSRNPFAVAASTFYTWLIRGTPQLLQLVVLFNLGLIFDHLTVGIPFTDVRFVNVKTNEVMTPLLAASVAFSINEGAYLSEIIRGGLLSVDRGQSEAGLALGMHPRTVFRRVVLPQAIRVILPPAGSELLNLLKLTSLVTVISYSDLLTNVTQIYSENFLTMELLVVAGIWYLAITSVFAVGQSYLERRYGEPTASGGFLRRLSPLTGLVRRGTGAAA